MRSKLSVHFGNLIPSHTLRAAAGLGLVLILTFAGSAPAEDVVFGFASGMGGTGNEGGNGIAVDASGNVYTTGTFTGTADFDPGAGMANLTSAGGISDIFVSKLDSAGNFVWAKAMGDTGWDAGHGIAVDLSGNVYTTGFFEGTVDFDPGVGTAELTGTADADIYVQKLDSAGNFVWAKAVGGLERDQGRGIAVDSSGNVYTTGFFDGTVDFDPGVGTFDLISTRVGSFGGDVFVQKLDSAGNFVWAKGMGGSYVDHGLGIVVDTSDNVYTTGVFQDMADFDPGPGTFNLISEGGNDIFVSKLDSAGTFVWAKAMGGIDGDEGDGIAVDSSGNVYSTGFFEGTVDFDPGAGTADLTSAGSLDSFVQKLNSAGIFVWAKAMGGTDPQGGSGIAVDTSGNVYTTGSLEGTADFDPGSGTANLTSAGLNDIFVSKLDSAGDFVWAKAMGGTSFDVGLGIAVDGSGGVYTTGFFDGTADFDPGAGTANLTSAGSIDIFVSKLSSLATWVDFGFVGIEDGSFDNPFNMLAEGLFAVVDAGTVMIKGNTGDSVSDETMTINQIVTIEAVSGPVRIGDVGGRSSDSGRQSGFVSRD